MAAQRDTEIRRDLHEIQVDQAALHHLPTVLSAMLIKEAREKSIVPIIKAPESTATQSLP